MPRLWGRELIFLPLMVPWWWISAAEPRHGGGVFGRVSTMRSVKLAGTHFDEAIIKYMRRKYNLIIGQKTAENAKTAIGCVYPKEELSYYVMKGRNGLSGLPQAVTVSSDEMLECSWNVGCR